MSKKKKECHENTQGDKIAKINLSKNMFIHNCSFVYLFDHFSVIVAACSIAGLVGLIMAGVCWYK